MKENVPEFLNNIDWSLLRQQKNTLLNLIKNESLKPLMIFVGDDLDGILNLIDSLQDYAVDVMGVPEMNVFDFESEDELDAMHDKQREEETPEELFAREQAETIYQMHIESSYLYEHNEMPEEFIKSIVDDKQHSTIIKDFIRQSILDGVTNYPNDYQRDEEGNLIYDITMNDEGYEIERYCQEKWDDNKTKEVWLCNHCSSDNVEHKVYQNPNTGEISEAVSPQAQCNDCECECSIIKHTIPFKKKVIGFIITNDVGENMYDENNVYNHSQAMRMMMIGLKLKTVWSGDIENPQFQYDYYKGDPRD